MSDIIPVIIPVNAENFESVVLQNDLPVIIAVGASWCPDCRRAQPFYMQFAKEFEGRAVFTMIDSEASPDLKDRLGIQHIPTMLIAKGGVIRDERLVEVKMPSDLKRFIESAFV